MEVIVLLKVCWICYVKFVFYEKRDILIIILCKCMYIYKYNIYYLILGIVEVFKKKNLIGV